jgi:hypothetical protein
MKFNVYEFALMSRFLELGKRYGLEPWELPIEYDRSTGETYITGEPADRDAFVRFNEMVKVLGGTEGERAAFPHEEGQDMLEALDEAIQNAPRKWVR